LFNADQDCPNPRGWHSDMVNNLGVNVTYPEGVAAFQAAARDWSKRIVEYCTVGIAPVRCSGVLFWSIEGSQYTWDTYVGSPDRLEEISPEMAGTCDLTDASQVQVMDHTHTDAYNHTPRPLHHLTLTRMFTQPRSPHHHNHHNHHNHHHHHAQSHEKHNST
jgi:hypothetical protein